MRVNLVYWDNGAGITRTAGIVAELLGSLGATVTHSPVSSPRFAPRQFARIRSLIGRPDFDLNFFCERVGLGWFPYSRRNILLPNQEWFRPEWIPTLPRFDLVLAKTREGERCFRELGATVQFVGFTSRDHRLAQPPAPEEGVLHVAGRSVQKGTDSVLRVWSRHPEWPQLTVVQRPKSPDEPVDSPPLPNVTYLTEYLSDAELRRLQHKYWLHVRPSLAEGFGHPFAESMSCGAVVITTDAPPMNELVGPDRGFLVQASPLGPQGIGTLYQVDDDALEAAIARALALPIDERTLLSRNARTWFEANDKAFRQRFVSIMARFASPD